MSVTRILYVVARNRPDVYTVLRETFVESSRLGIVLDRRGEQPPSAEIQERRRLTVDEPLRTRGWARVRIEPDGRAKLA
jgi:hypothetical protein